MEYNSLTIKIIQLNNIEERKKIEDFLAIHSLRLENDVEYTVAIYNDNKIVATGSFAGNVIKCIAIDFDYEGQGLALKIISLLVTEEYNQGRNHLFIYTEPKNIKKFENIGFHVIEQIKSKVVLMENRQKGIWEYIKKLKTFKTPGSVVGSIILNANPFTKGHLHLIEKAASECDNLHIFVVWEDKSVFPVSIRYKLVKEGTKHLHNVLVHKGGNYIISNATFPTYFLKRPEESLELQCLLDVKIFAKYIALGLKITKRYIGEEPYCEITQIYNKTMKEILPKYGIEVIEINRIKSLSTPISASAVRKYLLEGNMETVLSMVPEVTYNFLMSKGAISVLNNINKSKGSVVDGC